MESRHAIKYICTGLVSGAVTTLVYSFEPEHAEEGVNFYVSIFGNSRVLRITHYGEAGPEDAGKMMPIDFQLEGLVLRFKA